MLILLAPSKTQDFESAPQTMLSSPAYFLELTRRIHAELKRLSEEDIAKLMKVSEKLAKETKSKIEKFQTPLGIHSAKPALCAFTGDVYSGFDLDTYDDDDFMFAQDHIRILSGMYGAIKPLDLMEPYRLEMQTPIAVGDDKNLYEFWRDYLTNYINKAEQECIVNLASAEYFKALNAKQLVAPVVTPVFKERKDGKEKVIAIFAKRARGTMANWVVKNRIDNAEDLKKFCEDGYAFDKAQSTETEFVFVR